MMITQPAFFCLEATWHRILGRATPGRVDEISVWDRPAPPEGPIPPLPDAAPIARVEPAATAPTALATSESNPSGPLTVAERRARAAALRALSLCRQRRFTGARSAFAEAARLDPLLDLTRTPGFWNLERAAHEAAIDAYGDVARDRDAAVLRARVRSTYRPKPLRSRPEAVLSP
jgi:hypothetical protein